MYLSEGWKCLFLRYKTDMHKSITYFSKEGIDRAQKVYVVPLLVSSRVWSQSVVLQVVFGILPFALSHFSPGEGWGASVPERNTFWITKMFQQGLCGLNSCWLCCGKWEECLGRRWVPGLMPAGKWQHSPWERSHDLPYVLAAAEVGAWASWEFGITLWSLKQSCL